MSEWSRIVKGGTKWRAERPLTSLRNELHCGAEGIWGVAIYRLRKIKKELIQESTFL
jgi:hypothetical protein